MGIWRHLDVVRSWILLVPTSIWRGQPGLRQSWARYMDRLPLRSEGSLPGFRAKRWDGLSPDGVLRFLFFSFSKPSARLHFLFSSFFKPSARHWLSIIIVILFYINWSNSLYLLKRSLKLIFNQITVSNCIRSNAKRWTTSRLQSLEHYHPHSDFNSDQFDSNLF